MTYMFIKMAHGAALAVWLGGLLLLSTVLSFPAARAEGEAPGRFLEGLARWNLGVTVPAMVLTWMLGITLALMVGWFGHRWLDVKLAIVAMLTLLQALQTLWLARLLRPAPIMPPAWAALGAVLVFLGASGAILLALAKPFY
ncbi:CopD family protein [Bordetella genomosp. 5]|nr:CopD family protein [Bordetella genomosp. 5]